VFGGICLVVFVTMNVRPNLLEALGELAQKANNARRW